MAGPDQVIVQDALLDLEDVVLLTDLFVREPFDATHPADRWIGLYFNQPFVVSRKQLCLTLSACCSELAAWRSDAILALSERFSLDRVLRWMISQVDILRGAAFHGCSCSVRRMLSGDRVLRPLVSLFRRADFRFWVMFPHSFQGARSSLLDDIFPLAECYV